MSFSALLDVSSDTTHSTQYCTAATNEHVAAETGCCHSAVYKTTAVKASICTSTNCCVINYPLIVAALTHRNPTVRQIGK